MELNKSVYMNIISVMGLRWNEYMPGLIHALCRAGQLQGIKGKNIKGGDNSVHGCTLIKEWIVTDWRGCLMNTWLGRGPNLLNPHSYSAFGFKQHNKETCFYTLYCTGFAMVKLTQKNLLKRQRLWVKERDREGHADLQCVRQQGQPIPGEVLAF